MKPITYQATQHNHSGKDVPIIVLDIGTRRVAIAKNDVKKLS